MTIASTETLDGPPLCAATGSAVVAHQSQLPPALNKFHMGNGEDGKHYWLTPWDEPAIAQLVAAASNYAQRREEPACRNYNLRRSTMKAKSDKPLSRQRLQQLRNKAAGKCYYHNHRDTHMAGMCEECYTKVVERNGIKKPHWPKSLWATLDYSKSNEELAKLLGVTPNAVEYHRA
jgi:hypothetical protein